MNCLINPVNFAVNYRVYNVTNVTAPCGSTT